LLTTPTPLPRIASATASEPRRGAAVARLTSIAVLAAAGSVTAVAGDGSKSYIFQCELNGKKVTSDRLIPECTNKEQRQLNPDGSLRSIIAPNLTDDERAEKERQEREAEVARVAKNDAVRRDRNLMLRFPNEAAHNKARDKALDDLRISAKSSEARIALLMVERKKLEDEKLFYVNDRVNKPLPSGLRQKLDANEAALEAQKSLAQNQDSEVVRINELYDLELKRLKKLWAGAQPGSLGPVPQPAAPMPTALTTSTK
jgi:hypothetical protein